MKDGPALHEGHRKRLKNLYLQNGLDSFPDHNILELLLFFTIPRVDTNETAHALLRQFGSLSSVLEASPEELQKVPGVGENSALLLHMIPALSRAYRLDKFFRGGKTMLTDDLGQYFVEEFTGINEERVLLLLLDNMGRMIGCDTVFDGSPGSVTMDTRKILKIALDRKAASVVLAHNHPGGRLSPSQADIEATRSLAKLLHAAGIYLREHILVSGESWIPIRQLMENQYAVFVPTVKVEQPSRKGTDLPDKERVLWNDLIELQQQMDDEIPIQSEKESL